MKNKDMFLVTGSSGLLGPYLLRALVMQVNDCRIIAADKKADNSCLSMPGVRYIAGDLTKEKFWKNLPRNITHIFHLAAFIPWGLKNKNNISIVDGNLLPVVKIIEFSKRCKSLRQIIFSSSISVYERSKSVLTEDSPKLPSDLYGASKLAGENLLECLEGYGVKVASLRYSSLYGKGQYPGTVLPAMINSALNKGRISLYGTGRRTQDFLRCEDAAMANVLAYEKHASGAFNIGSGQAISMSRLAGEINKAFAGGRADIVRLYEKEDNDPGYRVSIKKASKILGYKPLFNISEGLQKLKTEL